MRSLWMACAAALILSTAREARPALTEPPAEKRVALAVIVNVNNPLLNVSLEDLRKYFLLERKFWPNGLKVAPFLCPSESVEQQILLDKLFQMSSAELRKYWVAKLFSGQIAAIPTVARNSGMATAVVAKSESAIAVMVAGNLPAGVRCLTVNGRTPMDPDYPLTRE